MKIPHSSPRRGFTLLETVIAIGVLAVLLTGFLVVFAPAAEGVRKSITVQQADRLASTLEQELSTSRETTGNETGFDKAFEWIKDSHDATNALLVYQYRADINGTTRSDGTLTPQPSLTGNLPGRDFVVVPMVRQRGDALLNADLAALEGPVYLVKCSQLIFDTTSGNMVVSTSPDDIKDPKSGDGVSNSQDYPEAVIAFSADFYMLPSRDANFISGPAFVNRFDSASTPVFSRNLAVRR